MLILGQTRAYQTVELEERVEHIRGPCGLAANRTRAGARDG
jgi:hypothetical protein